MVPIARLPPTLALFIAGICSPLILCRALEQEPGPTIEFRHERRGEGVADKLVAAHSPDKTVVVRVVGKPFKVEVRLFDSATETPLGPAIQLKAHRITALAVSHDNTMIATAIGNFSNDWGEVRIWNGKSGKQVARYEISHATGLPPLGEVFRLSFSDDGGTVTITSGPPGGR